MFYTKLKSERQVYVQPKDAQVRFTLTSVKIFTQQLLLHLSIFVGMCAWKQTWTRIKGKISGGSRGLGETSPSWFGETYVGRRGAVRWERSALCLEKNKRQVLPRLSFLHMRYEMARLPPLLTPPSLFPPPRAPLWGWGPVTQSNGGQLCRSSPDRKSACASISLPLLASFFSPSSSKAAFILFAVLHKASHQKTVMEMLIFFWKKKV